MVWDPAKRDSSLQNGGIAGTKPRPAPALARLAPGERAALTVLDDFATRMDARDGRDVPLEDAEATVAEVRDLLPETSPVRRFLEQREKTPWLQSRGEAFKLDCAALYAARDLLARAPNRSEMLRSAVIYWARTRSSAIQWTRKGDPAPDTFVQGCGTQSVSKGANVPAGDYLCNLTRVGLNDRDAPYHREIAELGKDPTTTQDTDGAWCADFAISALQHLDALPSTTPIVGEGSHILPADVIRWGKQNGRIVSLENVQVGDLMLYPPEKDPSGKDEPGHAMIVTQIERKGGKTRIWAVGGNEITPDHVGRVFEDERDIRPGTTFVNPYPN